jgi:hypothetical protein
MGCDRSSPVLNCDDGCRVSKHRTPQGRSPESCPRSIRRLPSIDELDDELTIEAPSKRPSFPHDMRSNGAR